ncbi:TolC family protein [Paramixta manurensis]|uniref:TolC family protein n=1 Tax=Paramixta manurensis TaxID=2740817 RepID=A0A6M8UR86_9GAMM|nr:TolC family protein [Erwiniaceae bacterium PD-1]
MKQRLPGLLLVGAVCVTAAFNVKADSLTLAQTLRAAERYSAGLSANQHQAQALNSRADSALQLPDPKLKFGVENLPVQGNSAHRFTRDGMTMQTLGIMQEYVSMEKRQRKSDALHAEAESILANSEVLRSTLQRDVAQAWLDLCLLSKARETARHLITEAERQIPAITRSVANGVAGSSVLEARLTLSAMRDQLTDVERDLTLAQTRLQRLTGETIDTVSGELPRYTRLPAEPDVLAAGVLQHPEVIQASREAKVAKARSAQSAIAAIPDVGVEVYYAKRSAGNDDMAGVMVTMDLPLFQAKRQNKEYAADVSQSLEATDRLTLLTRDHLAQLHALVAEYQAAHTRWLRQQQEILPLQHQRLALLLAQYRSGTANLAAVLEARRGVLSSELDANEAERALAQSWAAIRYLTPQDVQ